MKHVTKSTQRVEGCILLFSKSVHFFTKNKEGCPKHYGSVFFPGELQYFQSQDAINNAIFSVTIFSVGINDVLNIVHRVISLYILIQNLLMKAKAMFQCKIYFTGIIPIQNQTRHTAQKVHEFNEITIKA